MGPNIAEHYDILKIKWSFVKIFKSNYRNGNWLVE